MTQAPTQQQGRNAAALVCRACDGTTWRPDGTKGLRRCQACNSGILTTK